MNVEATVEIEAAQLGRVAELLDLLDGFLRSGNGVADRLADYLHTTGRDRPQPHDQANNYNYDANLVIDLVSFTAPRPERPPQEAATVIARSRRSGWLTPLSTPVRRLSDP
jgi:hypothetical protein